MAKGKEKEIYRKINMDLIDRPDEIVRMEIDEVELQELAQSILENGLKQPIGVTPRGDRFMIVFGDRRYLAHERLKEKQIMCRIEDIDDQQVAIDRAMENIQRKDLTPFEEGHAYTKLIEKVGMSLDDISRKVGKSPGVIQRRIDIMRMPETFQKAIHNKSISISTAEELWSCPDEARREYFLDMAVEHGITQVVARSWVQDYKKLQRRKKNGNEGVGGDASTYESVPFYRACDLCKGPVDYNELVELRICKGCGELIKTASLKA